MLNKVLKKGDINILMKLGGRIFVSSVASIDGDIFVIEYNSISLKSNISEKEIIDVLLKSGACIVKNNLKPDYIEEYVSSNFDVENLPKMNFAKTILEFKDSTLIEMAYIS